MSHVKTINLFKDFCFLSVSAVDKDTELSAEPALDIILL